MKKIIALLLLVSLLALSLVSCGGGGDKAKYDAAVEYISQGKYTEAYALFAELGDYEDAAEYLGRFHYMITAVRFTEDDEVMAMTVELNEKNLPKKIAASYDGEVYGYLTLAYDNKGRITKEIEIDEEGDSCGTTYEYDERGNLIREIYTDYDGDTSGYSYTYNTEGKLTQTTYTSYDGSTRVEAIYTYDLRGYLVKITEPSSWGDDYVTTFAYDVNGNLLKEEHISEYSKYTYEYTYDVNGNEIMHTYSMDDELLSIQEYTYDAKGNIIESKSTNVGGITYPEGYVTAIAYTYDASGNLVKEEHTYGGELSYVVEYTYDAGGNMTKMAYIDAEDGEEEVLEIAYTLVYVSPDILEETINYVQEKLWDLFPN